MTIKLTGLILVFKIFFRQLYLSITSPAFYHNVYKNYKGYGIQYMFTVSFLAAMIYVLAIFGYISNLRDDFTRDQVNKKTIAFEYLITQLPAMYYDGENIAVDAETPFYLYDKNQSKIMAVDPTGALSYKEKIQIPIIFAKNAIMFFFTNQNHYSLSYQTLFGHNAQIINARSIKKGIADLLGNSLKLLTYLIMPLMILVIFVISIIINFIISILVYLMSQALNISIDIKTSMRLAIFSSGAIILLYPVTLLISTTLNSYLLILLFWTNYLVFQALNLGKIKF